jgi:hypothetical protein
MKYVFWGFIGLIVLVVVAVVGGGYWAANMKVDFSDAQMAAKFKETYTATCVATFKQQLTKAGATPTPEQLGKAESACTCAKDPVIAALAKRPAMKVLDVVSAMATDPELTGITKACSEQFGIAAPQ